MIHVSLISTFLIPLAACIVVLLGGWLRMPRAGRAVAGFGGLATTAAGATLLFVTSQQTEPVQVALGEWFSLPGQIPFTVSLSLVADHMTAWLIFVVTVVGGLIVLHAATAVSSTTTDWRRLCLLLGAVSATVLVLASENFLQLIVAWQLLAVAVCGLAGEGAADLRRRMAVRKTAIVLSVGGCGLLIAACILWTTTGTLDIAQLLAAVHDREFTSQETIAGIGILVAAIAGCAQFPLWVWLPDAGEESPTAAACLQCVGSGVAGISLLLRFQTFLAHMPNGLLVVAAIGGGTALAAGWIAATLMSRARLLAFVTIANLGLIWLAVGTGAPGGIAVAGMQLAILSTGMTVICLATGRSRMEKIVSLSATIGLCGVPLLSGFWSLKSILSLVRNAGDVADATESTWWSVFFWCAVGAIFFTTVGLFRLLWPSAAHDLAMRENHAKAASPTWPQQAMLLLLAGATLAAGAVLGPLTGWLNNYLLPGVAPVSEDRFLQIIVAATVVGGGVTSWLARVAESRLPTPVARLLRPFTTLGSREFFLRDYYFLGVALPLRAGSLLCRFVDWFFIDRILIGTFARLPVRFAKSAQSLQNGLIQFYALMIVAAVAMIFAVVLWSGTDVP
ncbi:NADH-quinone oxidoreductase subunit 12 [Symmachiella dynata]|uniref:NADH-quinone oxidoreductase subunit 12 n=2 Tax=Symmachiella dynata TaxID=2527995 RepID=A0A517ZI57_9PLAN|nr:NADH-quinone oxidoreductase subunit 12 [Symmachiella dynata]